jgi:hypothetical protein
MPTLSKILGIPDRELDKYLTMTFDIFLFVNHDLYDPFESRCSKAANCKMIFRRSHTPIVYTLRPPVVYYESVT